MNRPIETHLQTVCKYVYVVLIALLLAGCQSGHRDNPSPGINASPAEVLIDEAETSGSYRISVGKGGGVTGLYSGYRLSGNGNIEGWQRSASGKDSVLWTCKTNASEIDIIKNKLTGLGMLDKKLAESGNMTTTLKLELPDSIYSWHWSRSGDPALLKWVGEVEDFCRQIKTEQIDK